MKEIFIIIWTVLIFIISFLLLFVAKRKKRKLGRYVAVHKLILILLSYGVGFLLFYFLNKSPHLIWVSRATFFALGILNVWATYAQNWTIRDTLKYEQDSFLPELLFNLLHAFLASLAFVIAPQMLGLVKYEVDVSSLLWDLPFVFLLPFLIFKLGDMSSQIPFRVVENPWLYPLEPLNAEGWPQRNLMQINFQVKKSLLDEYHLFSWPAPPWVEAPKEIVLGSVFRWTMQERRKRSDLTITANKIKKRDVIIAKRIPWEGKPSTTYNTDNGGYDSENTVLI